MKTTPVTSSDIARSVWAVPPLAIGADGVQDPTANATLTAHTLAGGVSTVLWGGNANIYATTEGEFAAMAEAIPGWTGPETWAIPSVGPDHGKLRAHADALRGKGYPAAMMLPYAGPGDAAGTETAIRRFTQRAGIAAILYVKQPGYLPAERIAAMVADGTVCAVKYAVESQDLSVDAFLDTLLELVPRERIVSGIGELSAIPHLSTFRLSGFTAGAVCIAPRRAMAMLRAMQAGDFATARDLGEAILPLEELRQTHGPIRVLHAAVTASGVADMGPLGPHFAPLPRDVTERIGKAVAPLMDGEITLQAAA